MNDQSASFHQGAKPETLAGLSGMGSKLSARPKEDGKNEDISMNKQIWRYVEEHNIGIGGRVEDLEIFTRTCQNLEP